MTYRRAFILSLSRALILAIVPIFMGIAVFIFMFLVFRPYVIEAFVFPTHSMQPTIEPGDRFTANKLLKPRRWDIVAYHVAIPQHVVYCKRLVGLPNERLRFEGGSIYINDQKQVAPAVVAGRYHAKILRMTESKYQDGETIQLGPSEFFVVGDNVEMSEDSREEGPSTMNDFIGVADWRYWPLSRMGLLR